MPEVQERLDRLEYLVGRPGRPRSAIVSELRRALSIIHHDLFSGPRAGLRGSKGLHESFHMLARRVDRAKTTEDLRNAVRDARQFALSVTSVLQTQDVEQRLHELEGRIKTATEVASPDASVLDGDVVTLESLSTKRLLFAIMPFQDELADVWTGGIKRAAAGTGLTPIRIDMLTKTSEITDDIVRAIRMAELVVVDVTHNNANVMFEFGFALALKKRHVVISQSTDYLPFDIKNLRTVIYRNSWQGIETLHKDLQAFIKGANQPASKRASRARAKKVTSSK